MQRLACLLALLLGSTGTVLAQTDPEPRRGPSRIVLALAGTGASVGTLVAFGTLSPDAAGVGLLATPVVSAAAVHYTGRALGGDGGFGRTLGGAALGALPGVALVVVGALVETSDNFEPDQEEEAGPIFYAAGVAYLVGPAVGAALRYDGVRSGISFQRVPGGETVPAVALRVGL